MAERISSLVTGLLALVCVAALQELVDMAKPSNMRIAIFIRLVACSVRLRMQGILNQFLHFRVGFTR